MASKSIAVYFLCAGYGLRLRPLTDRIPKPALTFQGISALERNFRKTQRLNPSGYLCNTHHLPAEMERLAASLGISALHETEILGTGGCFWNAKPRLEKTDLFLVHNGDLIHNIDLGVLVEKHIASGNIATLAGIFREGQNTLSCDNQGRLLGIQGYAGFGSSDQDARLTFSGIAVYDRAFLEHVRPGVEDIKYFWTRALDAGCAISVTDCTDKAWFDFGTPQGLWDAARFAMEESGNFRYNYASGTEEKPRVSNEAGQENLPAGLRNVLICEKTVTEINPDTENCVLGRDFRWTVQG